MRILNLLFLTAAPLAAAVCYYPSGYSEASLEYQPCNQYTGASMCCGTNRNNPSGSSRDNGNGNTQDKCLKNGLCSNEWETTDDNGTTVENIEYFRDQCTSTNWQDDCLNICTQETNPGVGSSSEMVMVIPCDGTATSSTWCCGNSTECCDKSPVTIAQVFAPDTTTSASSSTSTQHTTATSAPTSSPFATSSSSPSPSPSSSSGLSSGAKAGVGVGVALGVLAILSLGFFCLRRRKSGNAGRTDYTPAPSPQELSEYQQQQQQQQQQQSYYKPQAAYALEKSADQGDQRYEKPADQESQRYEMPS